MVPATMVPLPDASRDVQRNRIRNFFKLLEFDGDCTALSKDSPGRTHSMHYDVSQESKTESSLPCQTSNLSVGNASKAFSEVTVEQAGTTIKTPVKMDNVSVTAQLTEDVEMIQNNIDDLLIGLDESTFEDFKSFGP